MTLSEPDRQGEPARQHSPRDLREPGGHHLVSLIRFGLPLGAALGLILILGREGITATYVDYFGSVSQANLERQFPGAHVEVAPDPLHPGMQKVRVSRTASRRAARRSSSYANRPQSGAGSGSVRYGATAAYAPLVIQPAPAPLIVRGSESGGRRVSISPSQTSTGDGASMQETESITIVQPAATPTPTEESPPEIHVIGELPEDAVRLQISGKVYYRIAAAYYRPYSYSGGIVYVEEKPPVGGVVPDVPFGCPRVYVGDKVYTRCGDIFYTRVAYRGGIAYKVAEPPQ